MMEHIDHSSISYDLPSRISYIQSFLHFDPNIDGPLINATQTVLAPIVGNVVDLVYDHLLNYDITASSFAPAQSIDQSSHQTSDLHRDHPNIQFRKHFLKGYLVKLVSNTDWSPQSNFWSYLDKVGKAHAGLKSRTNKTPLFVEYREISLLLGWVENAVTDIVMGVEGLDLKIKIDIIKALNKYWWIQNDLFAKHYVVESIQPKDTPSNIEKVKSMVLKQSKTIIPVMSTIALFTAYQIFQ